MKNIIQLTSILILLPFLLKAQGIYPTNSYKCKVKYTPTPKCIQKEKISFLLGAGGSTYSGELSKGKYEANTIYSVGVNYRLSNYLSLKNEFNYFGLSATNSSHPFESSNMELSGSLMIDLFPRSSFENQKTFVPYAFLGLGLLHYNVRAQNTISKNNFSPVIPIGLGVTLKHSKNLSLVLEGSYRLTTTDNIDGFRVNAINLSPEGHINNSASSAVDGYFIVCAKVKYTLNRKFYSKANTIIESANIIN